MLTSVLDLMICAFLLRVILQLAHANFYNPISQLIWKITQPPVMPLSRLLPRWRNVDTAGVVVLAIVAIIDILIIGAIYGQSPDAGQVVWFALLKIVSLGLKLYTLCLLVITILSWVGPGVSNPAANVLWSITEPVLRPVRRVLPPFAGLDLSPVPVMIVFMALDSWLRTLLGLFY